MNIIGDVKYKAFKESIDNVEHAYELYAAQNNIEPGIEIDISKLPLDSKNLSGKVFLNSDGKIELKEVTDGTYSAEGTLDDLSMLKGTVEDLSANRLDVEATLSLKSNSIIVTVETKEGYPTSYSYQIIEPEEEKKEINDIKENTYTFDKLKINIEYKIKVIVKNKVGLTKEITKSITINSGITKENSIPTIGHVGVKAIIYLNPSDLTEKCTIDNVNSDTETKTGCMKWYAYEETSDTYTAILDHNTTAMIAWNSKGDNTDDSEIIEQLKTDTSDWDKSLSVRLISADEIAKIIDPNNTTGFDYKTNTNGNKIIFFEDLKGVNTGTIECAENKNCKYAWLYDRTKECENQGCLNNAIGTYPSGYWTSTPLAGSLTKVWYLVLYGHLHAYNDVDANTLYGIRPVITIPKSNL